jgi:hypothetical protein
MSNHTLPEIQSLVSALEAVYGPEVSEQDIDTYERELGMALPESYKAFLRHFGNIASDGILGSPRQDWLAQPSVLEQTRELRETFPESFHRNLLPISNDGGGNFWCLVCNGADKGKVIFWQHDAPSTESYPNVPEGESPSFWIEAQTFDAWLIDYLGSEVERALKGSV